MALPLPDDLYAAVLAAATPVTSAQRGQFLIELAAELQRHPVLGAGLVHRAAAELQRKFLVEARAEAGALSETRRLEHERSRLITRRSAPRIRARPTA